MPLIVRPTILVVDDDDGMLFLIAGALRREKWNVATAMSGADALAWLQMNSADLLLLDLKLHDIEGREFIGTMADAGRSIPFIIITGQGDERVAVEMMKRGALDYLVKDINFIEFVPTVVRRALERLGQEKKLVAAQEAREQAEWQAAADLDAMTRLQRLGTLFVRNGEMEPILVEIVNAAIAIARADFGGIQLVNAVGNLEIVAQCGFAPSWVRFWNEDSKRQGACGRAMEEGHRIIVEDVERSPIFAGTPGLEILRRAGVRAVQFTPLVSRSGELLGIFSTHCKAPHRPDERALRLLDLLARQAADIIERQQREEELRESHDLMKKALEIETVGVIYWDVASGRLIDANETFLKLTGYSRAEVESLELTWQKFTPPEFLDESPAESRQFDTTGHFGPYEKEYLCKDGTRRWFVFAGSSLGDNLGVEFCVDITARKHAEAAVCEQRDTAQRYLDIAGVILMVLDSTGKVTLINRKGCEVLGYHEEEIVGQSWFNRFLPARHRADMQKVFERILAGEIQVVERHENPVLTRSGSERLVSWQNRVLTDQTGRIVGTLSSGEDITERKKLEEALIDASEREQRKFGHELHDGLGQRLTGLEMLSHVLAEDLSEHAEDLAKQARRLNAELRETVTEARLISHSLAPVPLDDDGLMQGLRELALRTCRHKGVKCRFLCEPPVLVEDRSVATHLYRIAQEAVTNALKHGKAKKIEIRLTEEAGVLELRVENNGQPLPAGNQIRNGVGLNAMLYRAGLIGGVLSIDSGKRRGVKVSCTITFRQQRHRWIAG